MWVTAVPQVRDFCRALGTRDNAAITNRLLQLIGLPPTGKNARFVEMWVSPKDMMRPCPDREVDDNRCEVDAASDVDDYRTGSPTTSPSPTAFPVLPGRGLDTPTTGRRPTTPRTRTSRRVSANSS